MILDLSVMLIGGTHTPAKRGGEAIGYQGRKKIKTSNAIWLSDRIGNVIVFLPPLSGNQNYLHGLDEAMETLLKSLRECGLAPMDSS